MMPKRIQMSRQRPWRADNPDAVVVSRPSKWGNPIRIGVVGREQAIAKFRAFLALPARCGWVGVDFICYPSDDEIRRELAGHDLACWCPLDQPCHADILLEIANGALA